MPKKYRAGVGLMLINKANEVLVGQRKFTFNNHNEVIWQMPQGGIDENESPQDCLKREALEEIGTENFTIIAETNEWLYYDLPENIRQLCWDGTYAGQKQKWFLLHFDGNDDEINIHTEKPEFTAWRWISIESLQNLKIAEFKRELYKTVIAEFKCHLPLSSKLFLSDFNFNLPKNLIAQQPVSPRDSSKLMRLTKDNIIEDLVFSQITKLFRKGDVLILNNSKVIPTYFKAEIIAGKNIGKYLTVYLNRELPGNKWTAFVKPGKYLDDGDTITLNEKLVAEISKKNDPAGELTLIFSADIKNLFAEICQNGQMPIPPYLKREPTDTDFKNYQTCFADTYGSVAAPTAGLHFNDKIIQAIEKIGVKIVYLTLHVGSGTFLPIKTENIDEHQMHFEHFQISSACAQQINIAKQNKNRIICVGTTTLRAIESVAAKNKHIKATNDKTNIFIKPGFNFKIIDVLITNFHTPKSTLLLLVSAFSGTEKIKDAYAYAVKNKYRFFSFGDACWLEKNDSIIPPDNKQK